MSNDIRLDETFSQRASVKIEPAEHDDERASRLRQEEAEARFELRKRYLMMCLVAAMGTIVFGVALYEAVFDAAATPDTRRWAQTALSALFTGFVGFLIGQASRAPAKN